MAAHIYFAGDTNVFSDMALIQELYRPSLAMLPIGDLFTMSPREAAAACRLLKLRTSNPDAFRNISAADRTTGSAFSLCLPTFLAQPFGLLSRERRFAGESLN